MSHKQSSRTTGSGFLQKLGWTIVLALVFSAGLITGQRMLQNESQAPLVSVTSEKTTDDGTPNESATDESSDNQKPLFSFYDRLSKGIEPGASNGEMADESPEPDSAEPTPEPKAEADESGEASNAETASDQTDSDESTTDASEPSDEATSPEESAAPEPSGDDASPDAARYTLQVSAYPSEDRARARIRSLADKGLDAHLVTAEVPDKGTYYRVRIGKFASMDAAKRFQSELQSKRGVETFATPL